MGLVGAGRTSQVRQAGRGLPREATIPGAECWYFVYNMLLNGSQTAPAVEPTRIPWDRLQTLIEVCFN
ncbi:MAG TPA: hypothetical protein DDW36_00480 [Candidatus Magasanikbacteria bacterium]|nr:hypothetical protein [Candidatus Magasanikbacteria bacterium]